MARAEVLTMCGARTSGRMLFGFALVAAIAATACKKESTASTTDDPEALAQDGTDTSFVESDSELLSSSLVGSSSTGGGLTLADASNLGGGELAPADIGDGAKAFFFPRGCLTVTNDSVAKVATYAFKGCTGPLGLLKVTGEVKVTYDVGPSKLVLDLVGTNLVINRATADWHAHAEITAGGVAGTERTMTWSAQLTGTTARGRDFTRTNQKTVKWTVGERCFTLDGVSEGTVKGRDIKTEIARYSRCAGACPEAGGTITITNVGTGAKVEITFDGTSEATFTSAKGSTTFPLACGG